ncbi:flavodoxin family protein [Sedimentibacter sp.]|uniref:flavodoxin family protein n=1 Tax=Sedimentibacter sp. TaxID=1960295 RepID=UPI0028992C90|nr:flavodoxin family protein [Sedimentibacter sp.]
MKILVLSGSPHKNGTTSLLIDEFYEGATQSGHEVVRIDTAKLKINPCLGCNHCRRNEGKCVHEYDDMLEIILHLLTADAVVLVSPLYYFGLTAQLKTVIDRFYSVNSLLRESPKKLYLIAAGADTDDWAMDGVRAHYKTLCKYLGWHEGGTLLAYGLAERQDAENSEYKIMANKFGKEI